MNVTDSTPRNSRIAVFIDFDNVEIGVKSTIGGQFDIGLVLEAIKERGEIVTKIAYSDWKRAGDYSRLLTQHAIRMVQRNLTPGGDKNGADITMALDALEMAFTHDHINAFVIVGGDSDFISLVEKLKQYGRKVIVVGGRQFTSVTMQRNCHEFIAYENLVGARGGGKPAERGGRPAPAAGADVTKALPLIKRALKVLSEREVTPQLGLLKSTLLQLDSTFSEREYGASSFRDFMEKVAQTGAVTLKHAGRSMLVESREDMVAELPSTPAPAAAEPERAEPAPRVEPSRRKAQPAPVPEAAAAAEPAGDEDEDAASASPMSMQDGIRAVQNAFTQAQTPPRFPMYVRQAKQFLRNAIEGFDERKYGFASVVDLLRAAGKDGVLRIERDRQGAIRVFPGNNLTMRTASSVDRTGLPVDAELEAEIAAAEAMPMFAPLPGEHLEQVTDAPVVDGETVPSFDEPASGAGEAAAVDAEAVDVVDGQDEQPAASGGARKTGRKRKAVAPRAKAKSAKPAAKAAAKPKARKSSRTKSEAADA